jgi:4-diphosphocytidyl-2-C-methyl-D-erythritol kinase
MPTRVRSYSKINLGLAVGPARPDGFHGLVTLYQTLALHDFVTVSATLAAGTRITLTANHPGVPRTNTHDAEKNTAYALVAGALDRLGVTAHVAIDIDKRLPVQGGMGAGSANAAAALLGLERELGRALPGHDRLALAAEVGSDVPLFLLGGTVLGLGRGEEVYPLPDLPHTPCVVAIPEVGVSTRLAFEQLDRRLSALTFAQAEARLEQLSRVLAAVWTPDGAGTGPSGITRPAFKGRQSDLAETKESSVDILAGLNPLLALVRTGIENDFEEVAFSQHPSLRSTKRDLQGPGPGTQGSSAIFACLSGSGSALFGLYQNEADARAAQQRVQAGGTRALLTETLSRQACWDTMFAE